MLLVLCSVLSSVRANVAFEDLVPEMTAGKYGAKYDSGPLGLLPETIHRDVASSAGVKPELLSPAISSLQLDAEKNARFLKRASVNVQRVYDAATEDPSGAPSPPPTAPTSPPVKVDAQLKMANRLARSLNPNAAKHVSGTSTMPIHENTKVVVKELNRAAHLVKHMKTGMHVKNKANLHKQLKILHSLRSLVLNSFTSASHPSGGGMKKKPD